MLSVRQPLRDISIEQEKVHAMVNDDDKQTRIDIIRRLRQGHGEPVDVRRQEGDEGAAREHADATRATIKLGLQRCRAHLRPRQVHQADPARLLRRGQGGPGRGGQGGGRDRQATRGAQQDLGRVVDPDNPDALIGTANVGQAHGQSLVATDLTPFGHHRAFLMRLFSSGVHIAGRDVKLMLECHVHAFEPCGAFEHARTHTHTHTHARTRRFQEVSFFLLLCGGPGSGQVDARQAHDGAAAQGLGQPSGSASAKAGMNGGFDNLCGRLGVLRRCVLASDCHPHRDRA